MPYGVGGGGDGEATTPLASKEEEKEGGNCGSLSPARRTNGW